MSVLSVVSFLAGVFYLVLGISVLLISTSSKIHRLFFYLCLSFTVWSFAYMFVYSDIDRELLFTFLRLSYAGWVIFPAIFLNFALLIGKPRWYTGNSWVFFALFAPVIAFYFRGFTNELIVSDFVRTEIANVEVYAAGSAWYWAYVVYAVGYCLFGLSVIMVWGIRSRDRYQKIQARIIGWSGHVTMALILIFFVVVPVLSGWKNTLPQMGHLATLVWMAGMALAVRRYGFLDITPEIAAAEIISHIKDLVFLLNRRGEIQKINPTATVLLGYSETDLRNTPVWALFPDPAGVQSRFDRVRDCEDAFLQWEDPVRSKNGKNVPLECRLSCVMDRKGRVLGVLFVGHDQRLFRRLESEVQRSDRAERKLLRAKQDLEKKVAERTRDLEYYATLDTMTGVFNRRVGLTLLEKEIQRARRQKSVLTVCFLDINGLKAVNDQYGHQEGDELILTVVRVLKEALRESDSLCRMGGDEFLVILPDCNLNQSLQVWENIQKKMDEANARPDRQYAISVSRGFAEFNPLYPLTLDELISAADYQMYQNKRKIKKPT